MVAVLAAVAVLAEGAVDAVGKPEQPAMAASAVASKLAPTGRVGSKLPPTGVRMVRMDHIDRMDRTAARSRCLMPYGASDFSFTSGGSSLYMAGVTRRASSVDDSKPPMMTTASGE